MKFRTINYNYSKIKFITLLFLYIIPSPFLSLNFPLEDYYSFLGFLSISLLAFRTKKVGFLLCIFLLVVKISSLFFLNSFYSVCYKTVNNEMPNKCIETFNQFSIFTDNNKSYLLQINEGVNEDNLTLYGHLESSWSTEYLTGINYEGSSFGPSAKSGEWNYLWIPFRVEIEKTFQNSNNLDIKYFGSIKILQNKKVLFEDANYANIKSIEISLKPSEYRIEYEYLPTNAEEFVLNKISNFLINSPRNFATLRIVEQNFRIDFQNYIVYFLIFFCIANEIKKIEYEKTLLFQIFLIVLLNYLVYVYINNQIILTIILSFFICFFKYKNYKNYELLSLFLLPFQILKLFNDITFNLPRLPGTVPQHHQVKALAMNLDFNLYNFLRGGDDLFYEPPLFRYLLNILNFLFGNNWKLVCIIFLIFIFFLLSKLINNQPLSIIYFFGLLLFLSSSAFLNLLIYGWSEPFNFLIVLLAVFNFVKNQKIDRLFVLLICLSILLRPEGILYLLPMTVLLSYRFGGVNIRTFIPSLILLLPMFHNLYFGKEFYIFSSTGTELGFSQALSKDGSVPLTDSLLGFSFEELKGILFIPFNIKSLEYVGNGFLMINLFLLIFVIIYVMFQAKDRLLYYLIIFLSVSPFFLYTIFDGYPRRAITLTLSGLVIFIIFNNKKRLSIYK